MDVSELTVKLLLLFFPGILCHVLVDALTVHHERKLHEIFLHSFLYGILAYLVYATVLCAAGQTWTPNMQMFAALTDAKKKVDLWEVISVTGIACVLGIVISVGLNRFWFHDVARAARITRKFGQPNVWSFALNVNEVRWATVRDLQTGTMFQGYIRAFSDADEPAEILLTEVCVYNEKTAEKLYEADHMYLARPRANLTVEFPILLVANSSWSLKRWLKDVTEKWNSLPKDRSAKEARIHPTTGPHDHRPHKAAVDPAPQTKA